MPFLNFLNLFLLWVLFGALIIVGFFAVTRGYWEYTDSGWVLRGNVGRWWWGFWHRVKKNRFVLEGMTAIDAAPYVDRMLNMDRLKKYNVRVVKGQLYAHYSILNEIDFIGPLLGDGVTIEWETDRDEEVRMALMHEHVNYVFPDWLRDMMAACPTCHASFYGTIVFWASVGLMSDATRESVFGFSDHFRLAVLGSYVAYALSLAYVNTFLWKRINAGH